jgi:hypothetical protein
LTLGEYPVIRWNPLQAVSLTFQESSMCHGEAIKYILPSIEYGKDERINNKRDGGEICERGNMG